MFRAGSHAYGTCIVSALNVDVCVFRCLYLSVCIILPIWHFRLTAAGYRVWLISGAELAVEAGC